MVHKTFERLPGEKKERILQAARTEFVRYPYEKTSYIGDLSSEEIWEMLREKYGDSKLILSGGSDFHGDFMKGIPNPRELGECGITYQYYCDVIKKRKK